MRRHLLAAAAAGIAVAAAGIAVPSDRQRDERWDVARAGEAVMPFDLELTTHVFEKAQSGGVQSVVADDPQDATQVRLIREHLRKEVEAFRRGDYGDPRTIHGDDMPGVAALEASSDRLTVELQDRPDGASIVFRTDDPAVRRALHAWFDAQVRDHGSHAEHA